MEPFYLPVLEGLHLIPGLCDGVALGTDALAGFPSLKTLPYSAISTKDFVRIAYPQNF